jgi:hypothetical protein
MYDPLGYDEFLDALPKLAAEAGDPIYWLWVFDPQDDKVILEHNKDRHAAHHITHRDLEDRVPHPERVHGYAYRIHGGWRITNIKHGAVDDPHIKHLVERKLHGE